jgi:predicted permease
MLFLHALGGLFSIILMVSIGYFLTAKRRFTPENSALLPFLVNYVSLPTFMIWNLLSTFDRAKLLPLLSGVVVPALSMLISFGVAYLLSNMIGLAPNHRGTFRSAFFSSSAIFVGVPVNMALFGESSIPYVLIFFLANAFLFWTIGNYSISLDGKTAPAKLISLASLRQVFSPPFIGFSIAVSLVLLEIRLPDFLLVSFKYLGSMTTPLSMLFIGIVMYGVKLSQIRLNRDLLVLLAGRFIITPLIVIVVAEFFPIPDLMKKVFVIQSALPAMTQTTLMAKLYGADAEYAAVLVSTTTVVALFAIPVYMVLI